MRDASRIDYLGFISQCSWIVVQHILDGSLYWLATHVQVLDASG
jgi:hypothetical protein